MTAKGDRTDTRPSTVVVVICLLVLGALAGWFGRPYLERKRAAAGEDLVVDEALRTSPTSS